MLRILSSIFTTVSILLPLIFAGIIIDIGLTSIYAHFGWELWPTFAVIGAIIGLIRGCICEHWRILSALVFAFAGCVIAENWMLEGILRAIIIIAVYAVIEDKFNQE